MTFQPNLTGYGFEPVKERSIQMTDAFVEDSQVERTFMNVRMMRIDENIHANVSPIRYGCHPSCIDRCARISTDRSTTLNNGAADADGR